MPEKRALLAAAVAIAILSCRAHASDVKPVDVPAGELTAALETLARQSGVEFVYQMEQLKGVRTNGVHGQLTAEKAVAKLLEGTALVVTTHESGAMLIGPQATSRADVEHSLRLAQADSSQAGDAPSAASADAASPNDPQALEEVIVTATKRAQNIQDAPLSVTAIGNAEIESRGLQDMGDYLAAVPGANYLEVSSTQHAIVIRGIDTGPESQNFGAGTTVATYFGETPTTNSAGLEGGSGIDLKLVDIDRIEILRGPQGTAFGSSSLGGAVRTIPMAPQLDGFDGKAALEYSNTGGSGGTNDMAQAVLNIPLVSDRVALRVVGYRFRDSGIYENVSGSDPAIRAYAESLGPQAVSLLGNARDAGRSVQNGGRAALLFQATDDLKLTLSYLNQKTEQDGYAYSFGLGGGSGYTGFSVLPSRALRDARDYTFDNRIGITNLELQYGGFGWADLVVSVSRTDTKTWWSRGAVADVPSDLIERGTHKNTSGEARLVSTLEGPLQFLAGLYHEKQENFLDETYGSLEIPSRNPWGDGINETLGVFLTTRNLKQDAVFGEVSYELLDRLTFTVGGRFYEFDREAGLAASGWFTGFPLDAPDVSLLKIKKSGESFKANVSYQPAQSTLIYATWAQGFRLGRPAQGLFPAVCDVDNDGFVDGTSITIASTRQIKSDTLDSYEIGAKLTLAGGRIEIAGDVFKTYWDGLPTNAQATCANSQLFYTANAGKATSQGVELQSAYQVAKGFRVNMGASYTDAVLERDQPNLGALKGNRLPGSPKWNASLGFQYDFNLLQRVAFIRADSYYVGDVYSDLTLNPLSRAGSYTKVDLRSGVVLDKVGLDLYVDNVTDTEGFLWRGLGNRTEGLGFLIRPRTVGMQVSYTF